MADHTLALDKQEAGREYLTALRSLGCEPEALFWAKDAVVGNDVLILVTSLFDYAGPLDLSSLLFKAYNLSATPREIDPFILRLHSPRHASIQGMANTFGMVIKPPLFMTMQKPNPQVHEVRVQGLSMGEDVNVYVDSIYKFDLRGSAKVKTVDASRKWRNFSRTVDRLAA